MKKIYFLVSVIFAFNVFSQNIKLDIGAAANEKMQILICPLNDLSISSDVINALSRDFKVSGQFITKVEKLENPHSKKTFKDFWEKNVPFVLFLKEIVPNKSYEWRLFDTGLAQQVASAKIEFENIDKSKLSGDLAGHKIADQIWPVLTGNKSSFSCLIVACKKIKKSEKQFYKHIYSFYLSDFLDKNKKPKLIVDAPTLNIAPRWHSKKPLLYFSQHTPTNVRLVAVDAEKKQRVVTNFDGLNMTPAISEEGSVVISLTKDGHGRLCKYDFDKKLNKGIFRAFTGSDVHAVSPCFINENEVVFCHIKNRVPCIAKINLDNKKIDYLTNSFSVTPTYCKKNNCIAYCKKVEGVFQILSCNMATNKHVQLTFDNLDKDECCWSACGNFIVFSSDNGKSSKICLLNLLNKEITSVTPADESWSFPSWSPCYENEVLIF